MELYGDVLRGAGHEIDGFTDPLKAYSFFSKNADQYDAVITDVTMQRNVRTCISKETQGNKS